MHLHSDLILASASPRRRTLLQMMGLSFNVHPSDIEEVVPEGVAPGVVAQSLALQKAKAVAPLYPDALTLGADTIVVLDGEILGKPVDPADACTMLRRLSGRTNTVYTGFALVHPASGRHTAHVEATGVTFGAMADQEIAAYVATGAPMDKAGAYGIQDDRGALFISRIEGDFYTVVGLPVHRLYRVLRNEFTDLCDTSL